MLKLIIYSNKNKCGYVLKKIKDYFYIFFLNKVHNIIFYNKTDILFMAKSIKVEVVRVQFIITKINIINK